MSTREADFTIIAYGVSNRMKTANCAAAAPRAIMIGRPEATTAMIERNFGFTPTCWPNSLDEDNNLRNMVQNFAARDPVNFGHLWADMQPLIGKIEDLNRTVEVLAWLKMFIPPYAAYKRANGDLNYRAQILIDDVSLSAKGSLVDAKAANNNDGRAAYGNLKMEADTLTVACMGMPADLFISAHEIPAKFNQAGKLIEEGVPLFGSAKEMGMVNLSSQTLRYIAYPDYPDPYATLDEGGQSRVAIECMGSTPIPPAKVIEYRTKSRWGIQGPVLPASIRAMAIRAGKESALNRPPRLGWLDAFMSRVRLELGTLPSGKLTLDGVSEIKRKLVDDGEWEAFYPTEAKDIPKPPRGMSEDDAIRVWTRWAFQEGLALAIYDRQHTKPPLKRRSIPATPAAPN
jgi:hypothetical protein